MTALGDAFGAVWTPMPMRIGVSSDGVPVQLGGRKGRGVPRGS